MTIYEYIKNTPFDSVRVEGEYEGWTVYTLHFNKEPKEMILTGPNTLVLEKDGQFKCVYLNPRTGDEYKKIKQNLMPISQEQDDAVSDSDE